MMPEEPKGGMRISRSAPERAVPPADQFAEAASARAQEDVAAAMRSAQPNGPVAQPKAMQDDSMLIELPSGMLVELGPPSVAIAFIVARIMGEANTKDIGAMFAVQTYVRALLYVRGMNGHPVARPSNFIEAQDLANQLSDIGVEHVMAAVQVEWPAPSEKDLKIIRKPQRTLNS